MNISNKALYKTLASFNLDDSSADFPFSNRLSFENEWNISYCHRTIIEYKKFIYLCSISHKSLTPSDQVDQVWHMHLTYSKSYWVDLCQNILNRELHHIPTHGGETESIKYQKQYQDTLNLYQQEFGERPPSDIWPSVAMRFSLDNQFVRINRKAVWLVPKPPKVLTALLLFPPALVGCASGDNNTGPKIIGIIVGIFVTYKIVKWVISGSGGSGSGDDGGCGGGGCGGGCGG